MISNKYDILLSLIVNEQHLQRSEARHEEVKTRERHHVDRQLAQVSVQLSGEPEFRVADPDRADPMVLKLHVSHA
mgnify:CR=1 FL=1